MVFYAGRLIVAHNRILYPWRKRLMHEVARAPDKPRAFMELAERLLARPDAETAAAFWDCTASFHDWGVPLQGDGADAAQRAARPLGVRITHQGGDSTAG